MLCMNALAALTRTCLLATTLPAPQITVPPGYAVDFLLPPVYGSGARIAAISNPAYGFGIVVASAHNGILSVYRISASNLEVIGTLSGLPTLAWVLDIKFDNTGMFGGGLLVSVGSSPVTPSQSSLYCVSPNGTISLAAGPFGGSGDSLSYRCAFTDGLGGFAPGAYLEDGDGSNGTRLALLSPPAVPGCGSGAYTSLSSNHVPPGRTDVDVQGFQFDRSGSFGMLLILADSDGNDDHKSAIYTINGTLQWGTIAGPVSTSVRFYGDMTIASAGAFGPGSGLGPMYVTEQISNELQAVDPGGVHQTMASGFTGIQSVSVSNDGNSLFVTDSNGVYRIHPISMVPGPALVMRDPNVVTDDKHGGPSGVSQERMLFSEPIVFSEADVSVVDSLGAQVPFSVAGSGSAFLVLTFGRPLRNDSYTITVRDTVTSAMSGDPIDGDGNGVSGGDLVLVMEHEICKTKQAR